MLSERVAGGIGVPAGVQKNVRLPEQGAELLRALKYDLDASDGEVVAQALKQKALERLRYHVAVLKRGRLGLLPESATAMSRAAMVPLLAALNWDKEHIRVEDGAIQTLHESGAWVPGLVTFNDAAQAVVNRTVELVREAMAPKATVPVLLLACCESPEGERCAGLGVPIADLAAHLRQAIQRQRVSERSEEVEFTPAAKSVLVEGCTGIAALDGIGSVGVEHILVAALQSADPEVAAARAELHINADSVRARLWA
jgi:crotonobetainyl-CoA:carnitine CoA-transferase CaiB-like acyl-CoA transferase